MDADNYKIADYSYFSSTVGNAFYSGVSFEQLWDCVRLSNSRETFDEAVSATIGFKEMINLDSLLATQRARNLLKDIADGVKKLMPCGDARIASRFLFFGAVKLAPSKERRFTTDYEITDLGLSKL